MKNISLLLCLILLSGCATFDIAGHQEHETWTFNIKVTSEPSGADIYLNNMLIGRTPAELLPIGIPTTCTLSLGPVRYEPQGQYYLRVSREGYKDAVEPIEFEVVAQPWVSYRYQLKKAEYHFVLEKKE